MIHRFPVRVFYEDTDMAGIVYHANYLKFIERARSDWVLAQGIDQNALREAGVVFVVHRMVCDFRAPARFDDRLEVTTEVRQITGVRLVLDQKVWRGETLVFAAEVTAATMTLEGRITRLPAEIRAVSERGRPN